MVYQPNKACKTHHLLIKKLFKYTDSGFRSDPAPINWVKGNPLPKSNQLNFHALALYMGILNFTPWGVSSTLNFVLIAINAILVFQVHFNVEFACQAVNFS